MQTSQKLRNFTRQSHTTALNESKLLQQGTGGEVYYNKEKQNKKKIASISPTESYNYIKENNNRYTSAPEPYIIHS